MSNPTLTTADKQQLETLLAKLKNEPKRAMAGDPKAAGLTITKDDFRAKATAVLSLAGLLASLTPTKKDDIVVGLLSHLFDAEHFDEVCALLGIV